MTLVEGLAQTDSIGSAYFSRASISRSARSRHSAHDPIPPAVARAMEREFEAIFVAGLGAWAKLKYS